MITGCKCLLIQSGFNERIDCCEMTGQHMNNLPLTFTVPLPHTFLIKPYYNPSDNSVRRLQCTYLRVVAYPLNSKTVTSAKMPFKERRVSISLKCVISVPNI